MKSNQLHGQSSWEVNSCSATQEILRLLISPNVKYRVHKNTPLVNTLCHTNQIHALLTHLPCLCFNIIVFRAGSSVYGF
jgi:hypothetical protein